MSFPDRPGGTAAAGAPEPGAPGSLPRRIWLRVSVAVALAVALVAGALALVTVAGAAPVARMIRHRHLEPMPAGTVSFSRAAAGQLTAHLHTCGFTPGSAHAVELRGPAGSTPLATFSPLTVSSAGQGDVTLDSTYTGGIPAGSRLVILNGTKGDSVAGEPVAETGRLRRGVTGLPVKLKAAEVSPAGTRYGTPRGRATIVYNSRARTLTVTVTASGLTPGRHAAHIHLGSCVSQGPVRYMLRDFVASGRGKIVNEIRVVRGVTTRIPATGWYLNIHQGNSATILKNGKPTIFFRPLLCAGL